MMPTTEHETLEARFQRIAASLPDEVLSGDDLEGALARFGRGDDRLLGFYTREGVHTALETYGILETLRGRGYVGFEVEFDLQPYHHGLRVRADGDVICECRLRRARGATDPCIAELQRRFLPELLVVDWLHLSEPRGQFTAERPRLPGQLQPGSGVGVEVFLILVICARRLGLHGLVETPERFHNAVLYRERTHFIDPAWEGTFEALSALLQTRSLAEVAWAMEEGRVVDALTGAPIRWLAREQLLPLDERLSDYFELPAWRRERSAARHRCHPVIRDP
ncbi:MAG: hypothetical protein KC549_07405 [Myxococcales bacterium]|nr:hypothetical protein [Myxococcales bacterium]MCB9545424.1 hypothetical protein [Myxococcales bacterium]